jgi:DNA-binding response OmpR family regulator
MAKPDSKRIVLAEDNGTDVVLVKETLRAAGIEADLMVFPDGEQCARHLTSSAEPPDAIILDLNLQRVDGFELLRVVRADRRYDGVPVAVLTSSSAAEDRRRSLELGANAFITKPSKLDDFLETVGSEIRRLFSAPRQAGTLRLACRHTHRWPRSLVAPRPHLFARQLRRGVFDTATNCALSNGRLCTRGYGDAP